MPTSDAPLALGIIGAGIMGERLLGAIHGAADSPVRVAAIWDPSPEALDRVGAAFPAVPRVADSAAVVAASDCVYVASPPASHLGYARAALAAGRSVFCEKPLATDRADARAFVAEAGGAGAVNLPFASSPGVARSERAIDVTLTAGGIPVTLTGRVGGVAADDHNTWTLEGDAGAVRLRDWAIAERRGADGRFEPEPDAIPNEKLRPITLRRQIEGVVRMARGEPHHLATFAEALDVQEVVEAILAL
ncbi:oxidoreductase [Methylobacterium oryzae]|uniref:Gfo/Idh/MocA family protein n=1 Tax=Methylobacterium oryzae TaxID=334852 RepID=UPI002F31DBFA